jgi:hypothetical protein
MAGIASGIAPLVLAACLARTPAATPPPPPPPVTPAASGPPSQAPPAPPPEPEPPSRWTSGLGVRIGAAYVDDSSAVVADGAGFGFGLLVWGGLRVHRRVVVGIAGDVSASKHDGVEPGDAVEYGQLTWGVLLRVDLEPTSMQAWASLYWGERGVEGETGGTQTIDMTGKGFGYAWLWRFGSGRSFELGPFVSVVTLVAEDDPFTPESEAGLRVRSVMIGILGQGAQGTP